MKFVMLAWLGSSLCFASDLYTRSIQQLGGTIADAAAFPETVEGFQQYLRASGVRALAAAELTRPNHADIASRLGFTAFLPPRTWWSRGAALALLTQSMETATRVAAHVRNWWRPEAYNLNPVVGGAKDGDHPTANAFDLDFASTLDRMKAEAFFRTMERRYPWMNLSFGLGALTAHIGLGSPRGHREWHYAGWRPANLPRVSAP